MSDSGPRRVDLYDTTLRDGTQQEGLSLSVADKLAVARNLDELGVGFIEGGWPGSNPKDAEFFLAVRLDPVLRFVVGKVPEYPKSDKKSDKIRQENPTNWRS